MLPRALHGMLLVHAQVLVILGIQAGIVLGVIAAQAGQYQQQHRHSQHQQHGKHAVTSVEGAGAVLLRLTQVVPTNSHSNSWEQNGIGYSLPPASDPFPSRPPFILIVIVVQNQSSRFAYILEHATRRSLICIATTSAECSLIFYMNH